ncbi:Os12g0545000 [Oryza sativa Japonica Group]|uniref:Os12g0545000 protein n=1 Tax=Oryza sativa subsp. japonica TaxID=39947 RepID=A0A0P0YB80_ORYSJ|nr:Os12g0545000 [Oryza sativa Japonica Group]
MAQVDRAAPAALVDPVGNDDNNDVDGDGLGGLSSNYGSCGTSRQRHDDLSDDNPGGDDDNLDGNGKGAFKAHLLLPAILTLALGPVHQVSWELRRGRAEIMVSSDLRDSVCFVKINGDHQRMMSVYYYVPMSF